MPWRPGRGALLGVAFLLGSATASADARDQSRASFLRGVADAHQGHFTAARDAFIEAYALFPHPSILLNLGIARWHTGEYVQAEKDLVRFLSDDGGAGPEDIANARAGLAAVRQHLGTLRLRVLPEGARATLDEQPLALVPGGFAEIRAVMGPSTLRVETDGYEPLTQLLVVEHEPPMTLDLKLKPLPHGERASGPTPATVPEDKTRKLVAYGSLAIGGASAIGWGACGIRALMLANAYNTPGSSSYQNDSVRSSGVGFRAAADVFFGLSLAGGGLGAVLLLLPSRSDPPKARTSLVVSPSTVGVVGTF